MKKIAAKTHSQGRALLDVRLAAYMAAAGGVGATLASDAQAVVVGDSTIQPFGINGAVAIDFNSDGQNDFEIDHDRIDLGGGNIVDYLQIDKNDTNGASPGENPGPINVFDTFDTNGTPLNNTADAAYMISGAEGDYPAALNAGTLIGPPATFDFQESDNFQGTGQTIRVNRLIDEDAGQVDETLLGLTPAQTYDPTTSPNFLGLAGETRYLGVKMNFQSAGAAEYGWIGIRITNEADATGEVVGWAYETSGQPIVAGNIPEPGSIVIAGMGALALVGAALRRKFRRS